MGDFNSVMNGDCDIITGERHNNREVETPKQLVVNLDLHVSWRVQHQSRRQRIYLELKPPVYTQACRSYSVNFTTFKFTLCEIILLAHSDQSS